MPDFVDIGRVAHTYPNILVHGVFSTKERQDLIPTEMLPTLWKYFSGIARNHGIDLLAAGGTPNHCHLLIVLPSDMTFAKAFSVSSSNKAAVIDYIQHQEDHHRTRTFETEFEMMIGRAGMRFDPVEEFA